MDETKPKSKWTNFDKAAFFRETDRVAKIFTEMKKMKVNKRYGIRVCATWYELLSALLDGSKKSERFSEVFDFLEEKRLHRYIIKRITEFEFVGYSTDKRKYDELSSWIGFFDGLPPHEKDFDVARYLSAMYKCKNPSISPRQISFVDLLYAAHLVRVKNRACIVTTDLNDYPSFLFDMPKHFAIEEPGGATSFVGIKVFNEEKYKALVKSFERSVS